MPLENLQRYSSYTHYLTHQASKGKQPAVRSFLLQKRNERVGWFYVRFAAVAGRLPDNAAVLCLGARFGEEVEAWRRHGFARAIGVDIEPYPPWVIAGDMNRTGFGDGTFDLVYSNALDHAWDIRSTAAELLRLTKPGGAVMLHIPSGRAEEFETHRWSSPADVAALFAPPCETLIDRPIETFHGLEHELAFSCRSKQFDEKHDGT